MGIKRQMRRNGGYRKMSTKNGTTNCIFNISDQSELDQAIKDHPEIQHVLDTMTTQYGRFDAEMNPAEDHCIIHATLRSGEIIHVVIDYNDKKIFVIDDLKWKQMID